MNIKTEKTKKPKARVKKPTREKPSEKTRAKIVKREKPSPSIVSPPLPMITKSYGLVKKMTVGRGFSPLELKEVGLGVAEARKLGLGVDVRRKSKHAENVKKLKEYYALRSHVRRPSDTSH